MRRRVFDLLASAGGAMLVVALVAAGALLLWANSYTNSNVRSQLEMQHITFPSAAAIANAKPGTEITPAMVPYIKQYAGQQVLTGPQAKAYADHFIAEHLKAMPYNGVYSAVSTAARAATPGTPEATRLQAEVQTVFQGTTLRGLLLEAYAFSVFGEIAMVSAIISFILAFVMAIFTGLGIWHARRTPNDAELLTSVPGSPSLQKTA